MPTRAWFHLEPAPIFAGEEHESGIDGYCGRIELEIELIIADATEEKVCWFITPTDDLVFKHVPKFDIDDLYNLALKLKFALLESIIFKVTEYVDHISSWESGLDTTVAFVFFLILWYFPEWIVSFILFNFAWRLHDTYANAMEERREIND